jgi:hypothetical protein
MYKAVCLNMGLPRLRRQSKLKQDMLVLLE